MYKFYDMFSEYPVEPALESKIPDFSEGESEGDIGCVYQVWTLPFCVLFYRLDCFATACQ